MFIRMPFERDALMLEQGIEPCIYLLVLVVHLFLVSLQHACQLIHLRVLVVHLFLVALLHACQLIHLRAHFVQLCIDIIQSLCLQKKEVIVHPDDATTVMSARQPC